MLSLKYFKSSSTKKFIVFQSWIYLFSIVNSSIVPNAHAHCVSIWPDADKFCRRSFTKRCTHGKFLTFWWRYIPTWSIWYTRKKNYSTVTSFSVVRKMIIKQNLSTIAKYAYAPAMVVSDVREQSRRTECNRDISSITNKRDERERNMFVIEIK